MKYQTPSCFFSSRSLVRRKLSWYKAKDINCGDFLLNILIKKIYWDSLNGQISLQSSNQTSMTLCQGKAGKKGISVIVVFKTKKDYHGMASLTSTERSSSVMASRTLLQKGHASVEK